jgi:hypothetical protein
VETFLPTPATISTDQSPSLIGGSEYHRIGNRPIGSLGYGMIIPIKKTWQQDVVLLYKGNNEAPMKDAWSEGWNDASSGEVPFVSFFSPLDDTA